MNSKEHDFNSRDFRRALGRFATGVTVVTMRGLAHETSGRGAPPTFGITVNAFMSISLEPPLVAVSIDKAARAHATMLGAERFGVSVLSAEQVHLSDHFAGRPVILQEDPYEEFGGFPVLKETLTQLVCRVHQAVPVGDHTIFVGEVEALRSHGGEPLLFYEGAYGALKGRVLVH